MVKRRLADFSGMKTQSAILRSTRTDLSWLIRMPESGLIQNESWVRSRGTRMSASAHRPLRTGMAARGQLPPFKLTSPGPQLSAMPCAPHVVRPDPCLSLRVRARMCDPWHSRVCASLVLRQPRLHYPPLRRGTPPSVLSATAAFGDHTSRTRQGLRGHPVRR